MTRKIVKRSTFFGAAYAAKNDWSAASRILGMLGVCVWE